MKNLILEKFIYVFIFVSLISCSKRDNNTQNNKFNVIPVDVAVVKKSSIERSIELVGSIAAWKEANLGAQTTARIQNIYVEEGSRVKEGDLLFEMDDTQLAQAKIQYQIAKDNYERLKPLYETGAISQSQFDQTKAAYEISEKTFNLLLTNTQFRAPFSGIITAKKLNAGEIFMLAPGGLGAPMIVSLMQINPVKLLLNVSEANFKDIKLNQTVKVYSELYPNETFIGKISRINPTINITTRTFEVEVKIPNPKEELRPGMYVRAIILIGIENGILINRSAALKQLGSSAYYAFIINNDIAKRVDLTVGKEFDNQIEIAAGLSVGDLLVIKGHGLLKDGSKVEIKSKAE